jgi:hypothetical protein
MLSRLLDPVKDCDSLYAVLAISPRLHDQEYIMLALPIAFCIKRVSSDVGKVKDSSVRAVQLEYYIYL